MFRLFLMHTTHYQPNPTSRPVHAGRGRLPATRTSTEPPMFWGQLRLVWPVLKQIWQVTCRFFCLEASAGCLLRFLFGRPLPLGMRGGSSQLST
jgi:hypothetical protein